jgi:hypothetical protein
VYCDTNKDKESGQILDEGRSLPLGEDRNPRTSETETCRNGREPQERKRSLNVLYFVPEAPSAELKGKIKKLMFASGN